MPKRKAVDNSPALQHADRELLAQLQSGSVSAEQKLQLVKGDVPACVPGSCKTNNKANPNCLCGWVPAENGFKKKGLWQRDPSLLSGLGTDPRVNVRGAEVCVGCRAESAPVWALHATCTESTRLQHSTNTTEPDALKLETLSLLFLDVMSRRLAGWITWATRATSTPRFSACSWSPAFGAPCLRCSLLWQTTKLSSTCAHYSWP